MTDHQLDTHQKALQINLDPAKYGAIAEIGAGQEVASWLFRVGAAAGTVAKTMSAYDMKVSDAIYGQSSRYVSRDRVEAMLDHEWGLLIDRLDEKRGEESTFFAFANTVSARNYHGTNICHGWLAVRYQVEPRGEPHTICLHVNLSDNTNLLQQSAVGVLGINLIYAAFDCAGSVERLSGQLLDDLSLDRVDIDYISVSGSVYKGVDPRCAVLELLKQDVTSAIGFSKDGEPACPMDFLYKCPVLIERGAFHSVEPIHEEIIDAAAYYYSKEEIECKRDAAQVFEITTRNANETESVNPQEIVRRLDLLQPLGRPVMVTSFTEGYHLTHFLRRYTSEPVRYAMGLSHFVQVLGGDHYQHLPGGIVEALSRLIGSGVKLYIYPMAVKDLVNHLQTVGVDRHDWNLPEEGIATIANVQPLDARRHLYNYLFETGAVNPISPF